MVFIACPKCEPNKQALFSLVCVACSKRRPTTLALDAGDSPACEGEQSPEVLSAGEADSTPAPRQ